jgi:hypothetical protein
MSTRNNFPWLPTLLATGLLLAPNAAVRADEIVLAGPHPSLKQNAVNLQFLFGDGVGDSFSGRGVGIGYGYMLQGPLWLDLQMNLRASACGPLGGCGTNNGSDAELMAGVAWRFRTDIPVVPYVRGAAGLIYLYPDGAQNAMGLAVRAGIGARYYVFDWLGFGIEGALSLGHGYYAADYPGGHTYAVGDMCVGVEFQFR